MIGNRLAYVLIQNVYTLILFTHLKLWVTIFPVASLKKWTKAAVREKLRYFTYYILIIIFCPDSPVVFICEKTPSIDDENIIFMCRI